MKKQKTERIQITKIRNKLKSLNYRNKSKGADQLNSLISVHLKLDCIVKNENFWNKHDNRGNCRTTGIM